ncbi:hypothetical protein FITA111629_11065 [Filibacter tadaridae]|uniref:Uncharacterized protein n=1 Tax=Filibacter tadaridae TaxID=2483811 RepID=A0A3P5X3A5_9BACL|nr:hypothetical protein FILTAD_01141 [Filibacter tadaridae]
MDIPPKTGTFTTKMLSNRNGLVGFSMLLRLLFHPLRFSEASKIRE